ncbi:unnamed protein product [Enterobius vermicularis]|uniref:Peptidase_M10 domain-containing protein n=1 Tax=Enterobius vermicularis TaxID=51028 RepID=A0A0N4UTQ3_ENTVE|nr:unnamed protein product [Enterobius vermicularis]
MFQSVAGLKVTGKVDKATKEKMLEKRCGLPDYAGAGVANVITKWPKPTATYSILNYVDGVTPEQVRNVFQQAFDKWSAVIPLNFSYVAYDYDAYMRFAYIDGKDKTYAFSTVGYNPGKYKNGILFDSGDSWCDKDPEKIK